MIEIALLQMSIFGWRSVEFTQKVTEKVQGSRIPEKREMYGLKRDYSGHGIKHLCENVDKEIKAWQRAHTVLMKAGSEDKELLFARQCRMADALDEADVMIQPIVDKMREHFHRKCFAHSLSHPEDPQLMEDFMMALTWLILSDAIYIYWKTEGGAAVLDSVPEYRFLSCNSIYNRFILVNNKIDMRDARHPERKTTFNMTGIMKSDEGRKLMEELRDTIFTTTFIDRISIARDGHDPRFRYVDKSLLTGGICNLEIYNSLPHD